MSKDPAEDLKTLRAELAAIADGDIEFDGRCAALLERCRESLRQHAGLLALRDAVALLVKAKGRFHTEQNYVALVAAYEKVK